jgi:hypothetical protein
MCQGNTMSQNDTSQMTERMRYDSQRYCPTTMMPRPGREKRIWRGLKPASQDTFLLDGLFSIGDQGGIGNGKSHTL